MNITRHRRKYADAKERRGVAAVEVAFVLPLYLTLAFASIEASNAIYLKRDVTLAAYVAATELEDRKGTVAGANSRATTLLNARGITGYTISITDENGATLTTVPPLTEFTVSIQAPYAGNSINLTQIFSGATLPGKVTMIRSN